MEYAQIRYAYRIIQKPKLTMDARCVREPPHQPLANQQCLPVISTFCKSQNFFKKVIAPDPPQNLAKVHSCPSSSVSYISSFLPVLLCCHDSSTRILLPTLISLSSSHSCSPSFPL